jgi:Cd2+/Zn2+-exporting ATPase
VRLLKKQDCNIYHVNRRSRSGSPANAQQLDIKEYKAELLPEDKLQIIQKLRRSGMSAWR